MELISALPHRSSASRRCPWLILPAAFLVAAAGLSSIFFTSGTLLHDSDTFHLALSTARANPLVVERLGSPIETGRFVSGDLQDSSAFGHAQLSIPIFGPKGHGKLYVEAHKTAGSWRMSVLEFVPNASPTAIDLLTGTTSPVSPIKP